MPIKIRPFSEATPDPAASAPLQDARTATFMETLRTRVADQDEAQQHAWVKKIKPAPQRKELPPARPGWMVDAAPPPKATPAKTATGRPFGSPKKRPPKP